MSNSTNQPLFTAWRSSHWGPLPRWQWLVLLSMTSLLYTFRLGSARTLTDHEAYVGGPAKQMSANGDWLAPRMGHDLWLEKPPLADWTANLAALVTGRFDEATVRFPSALAGIGSVLLVAWISARLFDPLIGFLAGLLHATSAFMLIIARQAVVDMQLGVLILAALALFVHLHFCDGLERRGGKLGVVAFWLLIGLMNLAKGPLFGAALTLLTCGGWLLFCGDFRRLRQFASPLGILSAIALGVAWPILVGLEHPAAWHLWKQHLFGRFSGADLEYNHRPFWYYLPSALWQWLPWTPLICVGCGESLRIARREPSAHRFVWWWFGCQLVVLSCAAGKGHLYLLHALPALAPVAALGLLWWRKQIVAGSPMMTHFGWGLALATPLAWAGTLAVHRHIPLPSVELFILAAILGPLIMIYAIFLIRRRPTLMFVALLSAIVTGEIYAVGWALQARDPSLADRDFLRNVDRLVARDDLLLGTDFIGLPRYVFYVDHPIEGYLIPEHVPALPSLDQTAYLLSRASQAEQLKRLGTLQVVAQSRQTRKETGPQDRYTLFRIVPETAGAGTSTRR